MASVDAATGGIVYIQGCKAGGDNAGLYGGPYTPQTGVVVLAFGRPSFNAGSQQYGSILFNDTFASTTQILAAAKAWAQGYWNCSPTSPTIRIALGTSNYGPEVTAAHGAAWAQMAKDLQSWIDTSGYSSQLSASGASDIEMDWNSPTISRNWACVMDGQGTCTGGFGSVTGVQYYNYGDAAGCPPFGSCNNGWSQEHVWYVSWGAPPSWPLPEIYNDAMAQQWYRISLYGYTQHGSRITIKGAMSQYAACQLTPGCPGGGTDFTQQQSWATLWKYITGDTRTRQSGGDEMRWSTDITKAQ